jgi:hypothetical protein
MAKELENFKKEWASVQKAVADAKTEINKNAGVVAQTTGVIDEGIKQLGLEVQACKDRGMQGTKLDDFLSDKDVKQASDSIDKYLAQLEKELKRIDGLYKGDFKKTKDRFWDLKADLDKEIKSRGKKVSTKLGTGNKSLPDMEKLAAEIKKYTDSTFSYLDVFVPESIDDHRKTFEKRIAEQVKATKEAKLSAFQQQMREQMMNTRVLKGNVGKAKRLFEEIGQAVDQANTALEQKDAGAFNGLKLQAAAKFKELKEINDEYTKAMQDEWIRGLIKASKDKSAIEKSLSSIDKMTTAAQKQVVAIAKAKVG